MMNTKFLDFNNDNLLLISLLKWYQWYLIGDYVKKDNLKKELEKEEQILNGKQIIFDELNYRRPYIMYYAKKEDISKDHI